LYGGKEIEVGPPEYTGRHRQGTGVFWGERSATPQEKKARKMIQ